MTFNYDAAIAASRKQMENKALEAIVLGPSGSGKSYLLGSFGVPTLYIYSTGETHGPRAANEHAAKTGGNIVPICMDLTEDGEQLAGDAVLDRVALILAQDKLLDELKIGAIAIDGAAELEVHIRASDRWKRGCTTDKGKHNNFAEGSVTCELFRPIFNRLKELQRTRGIHFAMTCMLDVKEYGELYDIAEASPRLKGYQVAEMLIQQFGDVLVVGPMTKNSERKWKLQFMTDLTKVSKDLTGVVKRAINFAPRLNGTKETPPAYMEADLRNVVKMKAGS